MKTHQSWILLAVLACGDDLPLEPTECTGSCVLPFWTNIELVALVVGDTMRVSARPMTFDRRSVAPEWSPATGTASVDAAGLVRGNSPGRAFVRASADGEPGYVAQVDVRVIHPDTSSQPFISRFRDARTGEFFSRRDGFSGRDSMDVIINYVLGTTTQTDGPPRVIFEVRGNGQSQCACIAYIADATPIPERGKTGFLTYRFRPNQLDAGGLRRLPPGSYDLFVIIPLADGRELGRDTGYPFVH